MDNVGFIVAGYFLTAVSLAGYVAHLRLRARRALRRAEAFRR